MKAQYKEIKYESVKCLYCNNSFWHASLPEVCPYCQTELTEIFPTKGKLPKRIQAKIKKRRADPTFHVSYNIDLALAA